MSAFFVSRQTIHDAVTAWVQAYPQPRSQSILDSIGRILWSMNAEGMRQRYPSIVGTDEDRDNSGDALAYMYVRPKNLSAAQMAKSVHCLRYQCCEGSIPEMSDTYDLLNSIAESLGNPRGYNEAQWDRFTDAA